MRNNKKILATILFILFIIIVAFVFLIELKVTEFIKINSLTNIIILASTAIISNVILYLLILQKRRNQTNEVKDDSEKQKELEKKQKQEQLVEQAKEISDIVQKITKNLNEQSDLQKLCDNFLINISKSLGIVQGVVFLLNKNTGKYETSGTYAFYTTDTYREFEIGEGITGQVAKNQEVLQITNVPEGYIEILSGLGNSSPQYIMIFPIIKNNQTIGVVELASFEQLHKNYNLLFKQLSEEFASIVSNKLNLSKNQTSS